MNLKIWAMLAGVMLLAGCASRPEEIEASYVSKYQYKDYSCQQLIDEAKALSEHATAAYGKQNETRSNDEVKTTVGIVLFAPTLYFVKGDRLAADEVARLKGQMEAIEQESQSRNRKGCKITFTNK